MSKPLEKEARAEASAGLPFTPRKLTSPRTVQPG